MMGPRKIAHFSVAFFGLGFISLGSYVWRFFPYGIYPAGLFWLISLILGICALIANKKYFPNKETLTQPDPDRLDIVGFTEVYVAILPFVLVIVFGICYILIID